MFAKELYDRQSSTRTEYLVEKTQRHIDKYLQVRTIYVQSSFDLVTFLSIFQIDSEVSLAEWLLEDSFLDRFYQGLRETYLESGYIHRMVKNRAWNTKRRLAKIGKNAPHVDHVDKLLSMSDLGQLGGLELFPEFLKNHPLVELPGMPYANFAGIGWLHYQRKKQEKGKNNFENESDNNLTGMIEELLEVYETAPKDIEPVGLEKFGDFGDRQLFLLWFARVWGCGGQHGEHFETEETRERKRILEAMVPIVDREFSCQIEDY